MKKGQNYDFDIIINELDNHYDGISRYPLNNSYKKKKPKR